MMNLLDCPADMASSEVSTIRAQFSPNGNHSSARYLNEHSEAKFSGVSLMVLI